MAFGCRLSPQEWLEMIEDFEIFHINLEHAVFGNLVKSELVILLHLPCENFISQFPAMNIRTPLHRRSGT